MTQTQQKINEMHRGNAETIIECISAPTAILVLNAIMAGTKFQIMDGEFGFVTEVMTERAFADKAEQLPEMITRIRVEF